MQLYIYICVYMHIRLHMYIYVYMRIYVYVYIFAYIQRVHTRNNMRSTAHSNDPWKETYTNEKRPTKETYACEKRPEHMKWDLSTWNETGVFCERDIYMSIYTFFDFFFIYPNMRSTAHPNDSCRTHTHHRHELCNPLVPVCANMSFCMWTFGCPYVCHQRGELCNPRRYTVRNYHIHIYIFWILFCLVTREVSYA